MTTTDAFVASEHHPTAWYAEMGAVEKRTFWAATGGWILDAMDVQMFSFAIPAIIAAFAITMSAAFANAPGGAYIQCDGGSSSPVRCSPDGW